MRFDLITHSHTPPHMHTHLLTHTLKYTRRDYVPNKERTIQKLLSILLSRKRKKSISLPESISTEIKIFTITKTNLEPKPIFSVFLGTDRDHRRENVGLSFQYRFSPKTFKSQYKLFSLSEARKGFLLRLFNFFAKAKQDLLEKLFFLQKPDRSRKKWGIVALWPPGSSCRTFGCNCVWHCHASKAIMSGSYLSLSFWSPLMLFDTFFTLCTLHFFLVPKLYS